LPRTPRRAVCEVDFKVNWVSVWLQPPVSHLQPDRLEQIQVQVLYAKEVQSDRDDKTPPIHWMLVTSLPIANFEQALLVVLVILIPSN
jgi:hypothetical protein